MHARRGQLSTILLAALGALVIAALAALAVRGAGSGDRAVGGRQLDAFNVRKGNFDITIPVSGELTAAQQIEIRNQLDGRAVITEIVDEGTFVEAGQIVVRLNDDEVRNKLRDAQDQVNVAEAALISAMADLDITIKTRESELAKADLQIKLADLALRAWQEGEDITKRKELKLSQETALKEFERLQTRFEEAKKLVERDFISKDEYKRDEIAMMQARAKVDQVATEIEVYEKYLREQEKAKRESDLDQARDERERVEQQYDAEVRSAQSDVDSKKFQLESHRQRLADYQRQHAAATVAAPAAGLVVYASSMQSMGMGRNEGRPPQVGTELTRNELIMVLPNTSRMIAAVKVSEALSGLIKPGQKAAVLSDAMPDTPIAGEVLNVGVMAESGGWRDPNRRDYTVRILLKNGNDLGLKPSMRCTARIQVGRVHDALHVPIQAVFRDGAVAFAYVPQGRGFAQRAITVGRASELYAEILEGLSEGEVVLLREPGADEIVSRIEIPQDRKRDDDPDDDPDDE